MKFILVALIFFSASTAWGGEFISPDEITPGMTGYGLTVFQGTEPETFAVESAGVMKNRFPKQDLVIIVMNDPKLLESNVVAGMSGSPIYFKGKLLGALAYGPTFSKKPIAYVTPIQNMMAELDRPAESGKPWQSAHGSPHGENGVSFGDMRPVASTLAVSGFSAERFKIIEECFSPYGLIPIASGGGDSARAGGPTEFRAGSAIGVQMMSGDLSMTAIGTVTHVDKSGRVLAFGHPFFNLGQTLMPATTAEVHLFVPSTYISYKLASPIRTLGSMVQDRQPAILIDPKRTAPMIPVSVRVENLQTRRRESYRYSVIREEGLTPFLAFLGVSETLDVSEGNPSGNRSFTIKSSVRLSGRAKPIVLEDVTLSPYKTLFDLLMLLGSGIEEVVPTEMEFDIGVTNKSNIAWITDAQVTSRKYRPGDRVPIQVRVKNQRGEEFVLSAGITLPFALQSPMAEIEIRGGVGFGQAEAQPRTLDQLVKILQRRPKGTDLIVRLLQAPPVMAQNGEALPSLPLFFQKLVQSGVRSVPQVLVQLPYETYPGEWLLLGSQRIQIEIEPEGKAK